MTTYIAMLRGVNVSGRNRLPAGDLANVFVAAGADRVRTYIQSGNVVFGSAQAPSELVAFVEDRLARIVGTRIPVVMRTDEELATVVGGNPLARRGRDPKSLHVTFLADAPDRQRVTDLRRLDVGDEAFDVRGREVYLYCPNGYGRTKLTNAFVENSLRCEATTRNWRTVTTLLAMARP